MAPERSVFESLASSIPDDERRALFSRIVQASKYDTAPIVNLEAEADALDVRAMYAKQGFWERLICGITAFFRHEKSIDVFLARLVKQLRQRIEAAHPGLVDFRQHALAEGFLSALERLRSAARFFYGALEASVDRDRADFIAFMASVYMEETDARLSRECDAYVVGETNPFWEEGQVLKACLGAMDEAIEMAPEDQKRTMYRQYRTLYCLRRLATFGFDRFIALFQSGSSGRKACAFAQAQPYLTELADIAYSLFEPPAPDLLEVVFLYPRRRGFENAPQALESEMTQCMAKADTAVKDIRSFMSDVPLRDLLCYFTRDLAYQPKQISGGEDWFSSYKSCWKSRVDVGFNGFVRDRQRLRLEKDLKEFVGERPPAVFQWISASERGDRPPLRHAALFSFIMDVFDTVIAEDVNRPLKIILLDGIFYRQENRIEYTDACNELLKTPELIRDFDSRLSPEGDLGKIFDEARNDFSGVTSKQHRLLSVQQTMQAEADRLVGGFIRACRRTLEILKGIIKPESGSRYDSLQNLSSIDGRQNPQFRHSLEKAKNRLERTITLIQAIADLESIRIEP